MDARLIAISPEPCRSGDKNSLLSKGKILLLLTLSSAEILCKQFGFRSGPANVGIDLDPNCLRLMVLLNSVFTRVVLAKAGLVVGPLRLSVH